MDLGLDSIEFNQAGQGYRIDNSTISNNENNVWWWVFIGIIILIAVLTIFWALCSCSKDGFSNAIIRNKPLTKGESHQYSLNHINNTPYLQHTIIICLSTTILKQLKWSPVAPK